MGLAAKSASGNRHVEVERKFDVPPGTVFPSFDGFSAVARVERLPSHSLDAIYFDTPKHDLAVHRVTLRRRTGGPDAGWHLKLPAGDRILVRPLGRIPGSKPARRTNPAG